MKKQHCSHIYCGICMKKERERILKIIDEEAERLRELPETEPKHNFAKEFALTSLLFVIPQQIKKQKIKELEK